MKANEILMLGRKIDAKQALEYRLVNDVIHSSKFQEKVTEIVKEISQLPTQALFNAKLVV